MKKIARAIAALLVALTAAFALTACGGSAAPAPGGSGGDPGASSGESEGFVKDLTDGVTIINDFLKDKPDATQVMLASDVDRPTEKYGLTELPFKPSDAVKKFTQTIEVAGGKFVVTAVSAETDKTWTMDQDGTMAEVTK